MWRVYFSGRTDPEAPVPENGVICVVDDDIPLGTGEVGNPAFKFLRVPKTVPKVDELKNNRTADVTQAQLRAAMVHQRTGQTDEENRALGAADPSKSDRQAEFKRKHRDLVPVEER
jgi:hypothetical protein